METKMSKPIPKARQFFRGNINEAVKRVQETTGEKTDADWWNIKVGNNGSPEEILNRFDKAYELELKKRRPSEY